MGAKRKGKAGTTGDKEGKPPPGGANARRAGEGWDKPPPRGHRSGRISRCRAGHPLSPKTGK